MKISTIVMMLLVISGIFSIYGLMVIESNDLFPGQVINSSEWDDEFNFASEVNETVSPLREKWGVIQDEDEGFFTKIAAGVVAIPFAIILIPSIALDVLSFGGTIVTKFFTVLNIPEFLITIILIMILVFVVFRLVKFFQREPI